MSLSNKEKFIAWKDSVPEEDLKQLISRSGSTLSRDGICKEIGIGRTSFKGESNKELYQELLDFEQFLRNNKILLPLESAKDKKPASTNDTYDEHQQVSAKDREIIMLKKQVQTLTTENLQLEAKLAKLSELAETVSDLGLLHDS